MRKHVLITTVIAVCLVSAAMAFGIRRKTVPAQDQQRALTSVRESARQKGHYVAMVRPVETTRYDDVESLTKASTLVVTGIVRQQRSFVPATNDRLVVTAYELLVQEVLKGQTKTGDGISVETLGGTIQFEDGATAEMKVPAIIKNPEVGKTYLLFLRRHKSAYRLVGGPQGLFEIMPNGKLKPQVPAEDTLMRKYDETRLDRLLRTVQQSATQ